MQFSENTSPDFSLTLSFVVCNVEVGMLGFFSFPWRGATKECERLTPAPAPAPPHTHPVSHGATKPPPGLAADPLSAGASPLRPFLPLGGSFF